MHRNSLYKKLQGVYWLKIIAAGLIMGACWVVWVVFQTYQPEEAFMLVWYPYPLTVFSSLIILFFHSYKVITAIAVVSASLNLLLLSGVVL